MAGVPEGTAKVLLVGPSGSGKSCIANFLSETTDGLLKIPYEPTMGCRILEYQRGGPPVEMWDVSGDRRGTSGWTAVSNDAVGVIIVFNGDDSDHERDVERWYEWFVKSNKMSDKQCLIMSHTPGVQPGRGYFSDDLRGVKMVCTNYEAPAGVKREVDAFVDSLRPFLNSHN